MKTSSKIAVFLGICLFVFAGVLNGEESLRMQVSPTMSRAPALLTVRINVEAAADNRLLQVVAESADFYRSSQVQLEGKGSMPLQVFEFRNLPTGLYYVTGVLVGVNGPRATVSRVAKVEPAVGSAR